MDITIHVDIESIYFPNTDKLLKRLNKQFVNSKTGVEIKNKWIPKEKIKKIDKLKLMTYEKYIKCKYNDIKIINSMLKKFLDKFYYVYEKEIEGCIKSYEDNKSKISLWFLDLLRKLKKEKKSIHIIFRTFKKSQYYFIDEWNQICNGNHLYIKNCSKYYKLIEKYSILRTNQQIYLLIGNTEKNFHVTNEYIIGEENIGKYLELKRDSTLLIRDDKEYWKKSKELSWSGKLFFKFENKKSFFLDYRINNNTREHKCVVDMKPNKDITYLLRIDIVESLMNPSEYYEKIKKIIYK